MARKLKSHGGGIRRLFLLAFMSCIVPPLILHNYTQILPTNNEGYDETRIDSRATTTTPKPRTTLVHYDPYFMGGFRNQHMRFVAFVSFAVTHNISQILLPSLRWMDPYNKPASIHHELLFDVAYWNSRAESLGLPTLVNYDPAVLEGIIFSSGSNNETLSLEVIPCWNKSSSLYSGLDEAFLRNPKTPIRRTNTWQLIGQGELYSHCRRTPGANGENNPDKIQMTAREKMKHNSTSSGAAYRYTNLIPHGGLISSGRLWWDYSSLQDTRQKASESVIIDGQSVPIHPEHVSVEKKVYQLLRPSQYLRSAADDAIDNAMQNITLHHAADNSKSSVRQKPRLLALHPRMEPEMFGHRCGKLMEKSLYFIFELLRTFPPFHDANSTNGYRFDVAFIAVSREQMESKNYGHLGPTIEHNLNALNHAREHGLFDQNHSLADSTSGNISRAETRIPIFESGRGTASSVQFPTTGQSTGEGPTFDTPDSLGVTELVASIINFFTLVNADIFVGVKGSTYSTDAFSVRYYKQKDADGTWAKNYIVGPEGISRLYGPAAPHSC